MSPCPAVTFSRLQMKTNTSCCCEGDIWMVGGGRIVCIQHILQDTNSLESCIWSTLIQRRSRVGAHRNIDVSWDKVYGHTDTQEMFSSWLASGQTGGSAHWNQCQTPEQSSLAKDSCEYIRHASSLMSFQIQAGKIKIPFSPPLGAIHRKVA